MRAHATGKEGIYSQADVFAFEPDSLEIIIRDLVRDLGQVNRVADGEG